MKYLKVPALLTALALFWLYGALIYTPACLLWVLASLPLSGSLEDSMEVAQDDMEIFGVFKLEKWKDAVKQIIEQR
jgi:hypothetical protein